MNNSKGHPKGLYLLFITEMWERFSYYGMRALFMLYMTQALLFDKAQSSQIYGSYTGLVYITPLIGGYIADRYWGNRRSILWGSVLMAIGQFILFFSACNYSNIAVAQPLMFAGLAMLIIGNGFFKPNISTLVGSLYKPTDSRKDSAFTIFYMGINLGAAFAPILCGLVGNTGDPADFKWGFFAAGIGMLIGGLVFELFKNKYLVCPEGTPIGMTPERIEQPENLQSKTHTTPNQKSGTLRLALTILSFVVLFCLFSINWSSFSGNGSTLFAGADFISSLIYSCTIIVPIFVITDRSLSRLEQQRIGVIYVVAFFVIFFWAAFEQAGASLTFFADEQTNREVFGWEMPAAYFQSFNAIFIIILAPIFAMLWSFLGKRNAEPSSPLKQAMGLFLLAIGYLFIALGVNGVDSNTKVSMIWLVGLYFLHTMGELCLSPIGLSMVNKLSPVRFSSLLMGVWFLSLSAANKFSGMLSSYYPEGGVVKNFMGYRVETLSDFFMLFVFMSGVAAVILFLLSSKLKNIMSEAD